MWLAAAGLDLFTPRPAAADDPPSGSGLPGRRYVIRGGSVMSIDPQMGDFVQGDVLVEGKKILAVGPNLQAGGAAEIDATAASSCRVSATRTTTNLRPHCEAFSRTGS